jgi:hypothetical protein
MVLTALSANNVAATAFLDEEALQFTMQYLLSSVEQQLAREAAAASRSAKRQQRATWHPATGGRAMLKLKSITHTDVAAGTI